jgi:hypothetical protein
MNDGERLEELKRRYELTWKQLANLAGLKSEQSLVDIRVGRNSITKSIALNIAAHYPELSLEWVMFGIGKMVRQKEDDLVQPYVPLVNGATHTYDVNTTEIPFPVGTRLYLREMRLKEHIKKDGNYLFRCGNSVLCQCNGYTPDVPVMLKDAERYEIVAALIKYSE